MSEPARRLPPWWRRIHPMVLVASMLILVVAPVLLLLSMSIESTVLLIVSIGAVGLGLLVLMSRVMPGRNMQGTKVWQNDGAPGGGTGA